MESLNELAIEAVPTSPGDDCPGLYKTHTPPAIDRPHSMLEMLEELKKESFYKDQIQSINTVPGRVSAFGMPRGDKFDTSIRACVTDFGIEDLHVPLSDPLARALKESLNVSRLYTHQAEAINHVEGGHDVVVSTATSRYVLL